MKLLKSLRDALVIEHNPKSVSEVDWDYDEKHPIKRFRRQTPGATTFGLLGTGLICLGAYYLNWFCILSGIIWIGLLVSEYFDDIKYGHLCPGEFGDYWRVRQKNVKGEAKKC